MDLREFMRKVEAALSDNGWLWVWPTAASEPVKAFLPPDPLD